MCLIWRLHLSFTYVIENASFRKVTITFQVKRNNLCLTWNNSWFYNYFSEMRHCWRLRWLTNATSWGRNPYNVTAFISTTDVAHSLNRLTFKSTCISEYNWNSCDNSFSVTHGRVMMMIISPWHSAVVSNVFSSPQFWLTGLSSEAMESAW